MKLVLFPFISRSGSTFLFNELSRQEDIFVCPEAEILMHRLLTDPEGVFRSDKGEAELLRKDMRNDPKLSDWNLDKNALDNIVEGATRFDAFCSLLATYRDQCKQDARIILFKGPRKLLHGCSALSPKTRERYAVRIVSIIRDGRAAFASQKRAIRPLTGRPMNVSPLTSAREWVEFSARFDALANGAFAGQTFLVKYEDLIKDLDGELGKLLAFVGTSYRAQIESDSGDLAARIPDAYKELHRNIASEPIVARVDAWRESLSSDEIFWFEEVARLWLEQHGYALCAARPSLPRRLMARVLFDGHDLYHKLRVYRTHRRLAGM